MSIRQTGCPIERLMHAIGGKYKPVILYHLMDGPRRFGVLSRLVPGVSQRMLTQHVRELEDAGLVHREVYREVPPRVEYSLTALGTTLKPVLLQMNAWAEQHLEAPTVRAHAAPVTNGGGVGEHGDSTKQTVSSAQAKPPR